MHDLTELTDYELIEEFCSNWRVIPFEDTPPHWLKRFLEDEERPYLQPRHVKESFEVLLEVSKRGLRDEAYERVFERDLPIWGPQGID